MSELFYQNLYFPRPIHWNMSMFCVKNCFMDPDPVTPVGSRHFCLRVSNRIRIRSNHWIGPGINNLAPQYRDTTEEKWLKAGQSEREESFRTWSKNIGRDVGGLGDLPSLWRVTAPISTRRRVSSRVWKGCRAGRYLQGQRDKVMFRNKFCKHKSPSIGGGGGGFIKEF